MKKEKIEEIGNIIAQAVYGPLNGISKEAHEKLLEDYCIDIEMIDEDENDCYGVAKSDSLLIVYVRNRGYLVDIPWNRFYPCNEPLPEPVPVKPEVGYEYLGDCYEYLGGWYEF